MAALFQMHPGRAAIVAKAYLQRQAKYAQEFLTWAEGRKFRNPDTDNEVQFASLPPTEQARVYEQWAQHTQAQTPPRQDPRKRQEEVHRAREAALHGNIVATKPLSSGGVGQGGPGVNQSQIVTLEHEGEQRAFIRKPAEGETGGLRIGIPGGTYHTREQAFYDIDALLGGQGVVPITVSRGTEDGSYQQWAQGARSMQGADLDHLAERVQPEDLARCPDFHRLNLLDLMLGHEDRHRGNLLYRFEGDQETPESLRLIAIDNGLSMAAPSDSPDHRVYVHPFRSLHPEHLDQPWRAGALQDKYRRRGDQAVADSLSSPPKELRDALEGLDLNEVAQALTAAGIHDEKAVRAALVRIAALQADPQIFQSFLDAVKDEARPLELAWREFQHLSGQGDQLLERAGASAEGVDDALHRARPKHGWTAPLQPLGAFEEEQGDWEDDWGDLDEAVDAKTRKTSAAQVATLWFNVTIAGLRATNSACRPARAPP